MSDRPGITWHPGLRCGQPCIAGTRLTAQEVARWHRDYGAEWILQEYLQLTRDDILLACWYVTASRVFGFRRWRRWYLANCEGRSSLAGVELPPSKGQ